MTASEDLADSTALAASPAGRRVSTVGAGLIIAGAVVVLAAGPIAELGETLLPGRAQVSSSGTNMRSFPDVGSQVVRRLGVLLVAVAATLLVVNTRQWRLPSATPAARRGVLGLVMIAGAAWYGWLAQPHNGFPSNARIHWVDFLTSRSDEYFYAAGRIPHEIFYDAPFLWQAVNVACVIGLCWLIARRLGLSVVASSAMAATPIVATNLLLFADTAEDVMLNVGLILFVMLAVVRRGPVVLGLALALVVLGRPSFLVMIPCVAAAEVLSALRTDRSFGALWAAATSRFVIVSGLVSVAGIALSQAVMELLGNRYMFTNGYVIDTGQLRNAEVREIDGFSIYPFSAVYLGHLLWVMPLVFLIGSLYAAWRGDRLGQAELGLVHFCALGGLAVLIVHESQPLLYYNVRYLTYLWPFLFVMAWAGYAALAKTAALPAVRAAALVALLAGAVVLPADPVGKKRTLEGRPEIELLEIRDELRGFADGGRFGFAFGGRSSRHFVAYVMASESWSVWGDLDDVDVGWLVISTRSDPWLERPADFETESLLVHAVRASDLEE